MMPHWREVDPLRTARAPLKDETPLHGFGCALVAMAALLLVLAVAAAMAGML